MKNPINVYLSEKVKNGEAELVKFAAYISYIDTNKEGKIRIGFKSDTSDKESGLVYVTAWLNEEGKGPDWSKIITEDKKGRYAVALAVHTSSNGYENYALNSIDFAPVPKN